ncbi:dipeptide ABC transporter ATP-binding protein [Arthrobacter castelli]|uniref:dipeptide ABC transporter ATP-binding protein n=1 Tax=Arthrobacter castelli TaxID=271431 RepID=UPI000417D178|nr:ABC transporter ATP-binding protein [Arthrobacter castelli]
MTSTTLATEAALKIDDLNVAFTAESGTVPAVEGVSLQVAPGEVLALVGESGSGKSTVALTAMGLLPSNAQMTGNVSVAGSTIDVPDGRSLNKIRGRVVSMVFQEPASALNPLKRIGDQIAEVITNHTDVPAREAKARAVTLLDRVGIADPEQRIRDYPFQLSGGQRQRVVIAIAIANDPALLIADEPTTALDVTVQAEILDLLRSLASGTNTAVLLVTHNMGVVADFAERVAVMLKGELVESGQVNDVLLHPQHEYTRRLLKAVPRLRVTTDEPDPENTNTESAVSASEHIALEFENVSVTYGRGRRRFEALKSVSFQLPQSATLGLVGESGSGKSTTGRAAIGLLKPSAGSVRLFNRDLRSLPWRTRRKFQAQIGIVLQDPVASLDPRMSVMDCVAEPLMTHRRLSGTERRQKVASLLDSVHLPAGVIRRFPHELSGGQRQRVSMARALILEPRLLIADEATSALDVSVQASVLSVLTELQQTYGFACLFISHDLAVVQQMSQTVAVMRRGEIVESGPTGSVLVNPEVEYTRELLSAAPVPDPVVQKQRRRTVEVGGSVGQ